MRLVIDNPCRHEQRRLKGGVVQDVEHSSHRAERCSRAQKHGD